MILSSSSIVRFLALAILVVSTRSSRSRSSSSRSIRGNTKQQNDQDSESPRDLVEIDTTMGLGEMDCKEHPLGDGSVVCTFRTMLPTNFTPGKLLYNCVGTVCLASEVHRVLPDQIPPGALVTTTPQKPQPLPAEPVIPVEVIPVAVNPNPVGSVGTCPDRQPNTGWGCTHYIPERATETLCVYGRTRCQCRLQDNDPTIAVGWTCRQQQQQPVPLPPTNIDNAVVPKPPPSNNDSFGNFQCRPVGSGCAAPHTLPSSCSGSPACCPESIIEDWRTERNTCKHDSNINVDINVLSPPTPAPANGSFGQILPNLVNDPRCPQLANRPYTGDGCGYGQWNMMCSYYVSDTDGVKIGAEDCACVGDYTFQCRESRLPVFSF